MTIRDITPTTDSPRRNLTISVCTEPAHRIDPFAFVPGDGRHGGIEVITGRKQVPLGNHQTVCVSNARNGVIVQMAVLHGRLYLYGAGIATPIPTEGQVRDAVEHLYTRRSIARRLGLRLEPIQASFATRTAQAAQERAMQRHIPDEADGLSWLERG
jgi:hypothetical protein